MINTSHRTKLITLSNVELVLTSLR